MMHIFLEDYIFKGPLSREPKQMLEIDNAVTVGELVKALNYEEYYVVVNDRVPPYTYVLQEGDIVTIIAHLTGG